MDINRLRWASRRGMLELDLVLLPFLENHFHSLTAEEQQLFETLLECEDQDLFNWFLRKNLPDDENLRRIVTIILSHTGLQDGR
ncbi:succinate dehydrogenase assembly factor 2 [Teredinibacter turnerae]|uniref:FAD assembly factor SdhE n=1 Tax=Teredinibacter turnerae TaxID=2426 RepID=UPI00048A903D|nr:succinate dehydrogenase assembly factor 2 [Teredinibacter turnerae]